MTSEKEFNELFQKTWECIEIRRILKLRRSNELLALLDKKEKEVDRLNRLIHSRDLNKMRHKGIYPCLLLGTTDD